MKKSMILEVWNFTQERFVCMKSHSVSFARVQGNGAPNI